MTVALKEIDNLLTKVTKKEKSQILQWVISDLGGIYTGIDKTKDVCGGSARITRTRIPVWLIIRQQQLGLTENEILEGYPSLKKEDLLNC